MTFKLAHIALVYPNVEESGVNVDLLQRANAWLQRRSNAVQDDLLLIGAGFADEPAFKSALKPYGLASASVSVIPPDELNPSDGLALGESVEAIAERWIATHHASAVPIVDWRTLIPEAAYSPEGWWWTGLEAADDAHSDIADIIQQLAPDTFKKQALTWATVLAVAEEFSIELQENEEYVVKMHALALSRWLTGFDAATGNNFYDFSASEALHVCDLDSLRLGFDAGRSHESELSDYFDGSDESEEGLAGACLLVCLDDLMRPISSTLSIALGGDASLFWSLYRSIWPDLKQPTADNVLDLVNLRTADIEDIDRPWSFVTNGWTEFSEE